MILLVTFGGFLTNAAYCLRENRKNRTGGEYMAVKGRRLTVNLLFCALAGGLWYSQFFGLEMGMSFLSGTPVLLAFSWSILMSLNVLFSNFWGSPSKSGRAAAHRRSRCSCWDLRFFCFPSFSPRCFKICNP